MRTSAIAALEGLSVQPGCGIRFRIEGSGFRVYCLGFREGKREGEQGLGLRD